MRDGGQDLSSGQPIDVARYFDLRVDIHHVFPQDWCRSNGIEPAHCDSVVNKTPLSAKTNRTIGGRAPSKYLAAIQKQAGIDAAHMDAVLVTHVIDPEHLRVDDFATFFERRASALLERIQAVTGRTAEQLAGASETDGPEPTDYETADPADLIAGDASSTLVSPQLVALLDEFDALPKGGVVAESIKSLIEEFDSRMAR
jgi:hypothetical protein